MSGWFKAPFHFASAPVSVLAVLIYAIIFAAIIYTDELYDIPKNTKGLDVDRAYADLHQVRVSALFQAAESTSLDETWARGANGMMDMGGKGCGSMAPQWV